MKRSIVVALLCTFVPLAVANPTKPRPVPPKPVPVVNAPVSSANSNQSVVNQVSPSSMSSSSSAGGSAQAISSGTGTASTGPVNAGSSVNVEAARLATAPDVISYPTAPCRIAIGASGGWFGGAIGFSGSSLDEACSRIETSRHLHNLGMREASQQIMCLSDEARRALEATGFKCLIKAEAQPEPIKP